MDITSALIRAEPKWLKVGEIFAEKEEVGVLGSNLLLAYALARAE